MLEAVRGYRNDLGEVSSFDMEILTNAAGAFRVAPGVSILFMIVSRH